MKTHQILLRNISILCYNSRSLYHKPDLLRVEGMVHNPHVSTRQFELVTEELWLH